ncbi:MAG: enoyl-CoA hydratase/isomerase family protein [Pseudomonadota bacterium]
MSNIEVKRAGSDGQIAIITLNRPQRANAMTPAMAEELLQGITSSIADSSVRAIVLTGAGKHFCVGLDADVATEQASKNSTQGAEPFGGNLRFLHAVTLAIYESNKPIVCAINGAASAGGLDMTLACDYRLSTPSAKLNESYVKVGLPPLNGGAWLLGRLIGPSNAAKLLLTGRPVLADEARQLGLVDELCSPEELVSRSIAVAEEMTIGSASLAAFIKSELRSTGNLRDALARVYVAGVGFARSDEHRRAIESMPGRTPIKETT